ncbi:MAG: cobyrinate a,c-diamide synthase [Paracoccaceae bacterium]|nr:cobyrinate a,c-diamide synthase [Paracoccaceae bacterium]
MNRGLVFASPSSGSGKTIIMLGILRALRDRGIEVRSAKSGPDYIDPGFHRAASGSPCPNLDAWAMPPGRLRQLAAGDGLLLIEGAMGLFDGAPPDGEGSTASLAVALGLPVVLIADVSGQSQSIAALYRGFSEHRAGIRIAGVILNRVAGERHERATRSALKAVGAKVLGAVRRDPALRVESRHLGLNPAAEVAALEDRIGAAAAAAEVGIDLDALVDAAESPVADADNTKTPEIIAPPAQRMAIADDVAFSFSYPHILADWHAAGAEIRTFSPLADEVPGTDADLVILPGGYPELHAGVLASADRFCRGMREARAVYGECGGFMVMGDGMVDAQGQRHAMLGLLRLETSFADRRLHLGYRRLTALAGPFTGEFSGHEFHYSTTVRAEGRPMFAVRDAEGAELAPAGLVSGQASGSFIHLIDPAPRAPARLRSGPVAPERHDAGCRP